MRIGGEAISGKRGNSGAQTLKLKVKTEGASHGREEGEDEGLLWSGTKICRGGYL